MEIVIPVCNTISNEIEKAASDTNRLYGFAWIESGLHPATDSLRRRLQEDERVTLLPGSMETRRRCNRQGGVYFLTRGWLEGEVNTRKEYRAVLGRFGPERTERVYRRMPAHYKFPGLIDTGAYNLHGLIPHVSEISAAPRLQLLILKGTDYYLKRLLQGAWKSDYFVIIAPFTTIELTHPGLGSTIGPPSIQAAM